MRITMTLKNILLGALFVLAPFAMAQETAAPAGEMVVNEANSLDELLDNVKERRVVEDREHTQRERRFTQEKENQAQLLRDAEAERAREERRSDRLET